MPLCDFIADWNKMSSTWKRRCKLLSFDSVHAYQIWWTLVH